MVKNYRKPVFQVVRQNEANAVFFAASAPADRVMNLKTSTVPPAAASMTVVNTSTLF